MHCPNTMHRAGWRHDFVPIALGVLAASICLATGVSCAGTVSGFPFDGEGAPYGDEAGVTGASGDGFDAGGKPGTGIGAVDPGLPPSVPETCATLPGLRGYWKLDEAGGTRYDESSFHNDLFEATSIGRADGSAGYAADLEADDTAYFYADDDQGLDITGHLTIMAWVKVETFRASATDATSRNDIVMKWDYQDDDCAYFFAIEGEYTGPDRLDQPRLYFWVNPEGSGCYQGDDPHSIDLPTLHAGEWYHVAATYDSVAGSKTYYLDGAEIGTTSGAAGPIRNSSTRLTVGMRDSIAGSCAECSWDGLVDEVAIFDTVLSAEQIGTCLLQP